MDYGELIKHIKSLKLLKPKRVKKPKKNSRPRCGQQLNAPCDGKPKYCAKYVVNKCYGCGAKLCKGHTNGFMGNKTCLTCYDNLNNPQSGWLPERM